MPATKVDRYAQCCQCLASYIRFLCLAPKVSGPLERAGLSGADPGGRPGRFRLLIRHTPSEYLYFAGSIVPCLDSVVA